MVLGAARLTGGRVDWVVPALPMTLGGRLLGGVLGRGLRDEESIGDELYAGFAVAA